MTEGSDAGVQKLVLAALEPYGPGPVVVCDPNGRHAPDREAVWGGLEVLDHVPKRLDPETVYVFVAPVSARAPRADAWLQDLVSRGPLERACLLVPERWLSSEAQLVFRTRLASRRLASVVEFSQAMGGEELNWGLLTLSPPPGSGRTVFVSQRPDEGIEEVANRLKELSGKDVGDRPGGYVHRGVPDPKSLGYKYADPKLLRRIEGLGSFGRVHALADLTAIIRVSHYSPPGGVLPAVELAPDHAVTFQPSAVDLRHRFETVPFDIEKADPRNMRLAIAGDIVIPPLSRRGRLIVACVTEEDLPLVLPGGFVLRGERSTVEQAWLADYLSSTLAYDWLSRFNDRKSRSLLLRRGRLSELPVPALDTELLEALEDLTNAAALLARYSDDARAVLSNVFDEPNLSTVRSQIVSSGRLSRNRAAAASAIEDPSTRFRTEYPHPLALRWREADVACATDSLPSSALAAVVDACEALVGFQACVGIALARGAGLTVNAINDLAKKISTTSHKTGIGDWVAINQEIAGRKIQRGLPSQSPIPDLFNHWRQDDVQQALRRLSQLRNREAHGERADELDLPTVLQQAHADLFVMYSASEAWSDLRLVHVVDVRWDSIAGEAIVEFRQMSGDHSVVPIAREVITASGIEQGSLYVVDGHRRWHLLRPFITASRCPVCRQWSSFHLEGISKDRAVVKSFEHGHTDSSAEIFRQLVNSGFLTGY